VKLYLLYIINQKKIEMFKSINIKRKKEFI